MPSKITNGKVCYIEMPATDIVRSAEFYKSVFGWNVRKRGDGSTAFDDTTGEVSGAWVLGRPPSGKPGLLFYIMVDSVAAAVDAVVAPWRRARAADWRRCARDHGAVSRPGRKRHRPLPASRLTH